MDCKIFKYCLSVNSPADAPPPLRFIEPWKRLSFRSGEALRNEAAPLFLRNWAPSPMFLLAGRWGETECDRCLTSVDTLSLDISCFRCSWLSSSSSIFFSSSSAGGVSIFDRIWRVSELNRRLKKVLSKHGGWDIECVCVCLSLAPEAKRFFFLSLENKNGIEENEWSEKKRALRSSSGQH